MPTEKDSVQCVIKVGTGGPKTCIATNSSKLGRWPESQKYKIMRLLSLCIVVVIVICVMVVTTIETKSSNVSFAAPLPAMPESKKSTPVVKVEKIEERTLKNHRIDPKVTWKAFLRLTERNEKIEKKKKKEIRHLKSAPIYTQGPPGPPGPRGLRGLKGPKGGNFTKEELIEMIKEILRKRTTFPELGTKNFETNTNTKLNTEGKTRETAQLPIYETVPTASVPQISVAFMLELSDDLVVARNSFCELTEFHRNYNSGSYDRFLDEFSSTSGRFTAPRTGFYTFFIRLHLHLETTDGEPLGNLGSELFSALLCIESLCQQNVNLETISGFPVGKRTTVSISGMLLLEANQYVSIFVDNSSRYSIKIFQGSQFSGHLSGV